MIFNKKNVKDKKCESCGSKTEERYSFCPYCGNSFLNPQKDMEDFGLLGRDDADMENQFPMNNFGLTDKLIGSLMNSVMKNLDKQLKAQMKDIEKDFENAEIRSMPNGIRIKIGGPQQQGQKQSGPKKIKKQEITPDQVKKISTLPKTKAKTNVKRIGDRVVYELSTPGVISPQDVFFSKLESGYEVKAIGEKKVYVNSIPISLPLRKFSILNNKLLVEFKAQHE